MTTGTAPAIESTAIVMFDYEFMLPTRCVPDTCSKPFHFRWVDNATPCSAFLVNIKRIETLTGLSGTIRDPKRTRAPGIEIDFYVPSQVRTMGVWHFNEFLFSLLEGIPMLRTIVDYGSLQHSLSPAGICQNGATPMYRGFPLRAVTSFISTRAPTTSARRFIGKGDQCAGYFRTVFGRRASSSSSSSSSLGVVPLTDAPLQNGRKQGIPSQSPSVSLGLCVGSTMCLFAQTVDSFSPGLVHRLESYTLLLSFHRQTQVMHCREL